MCIDGGRDRDGEEIAVMGEGLEMGEGQERLPVYGKERRCHQSTWPALALMAPLTGKADLHIQTLSGRVLNHNICSRRKTGL